MRGRTGRKQIHDSGSLFTIATRDSSAHLSAVILLSVAFIDSPKLWPGVSVAATSSKHVLSRCRFQRRELLL